MAQVNPRHVDAVMELINRSPYFELLGIRLTALSEGACTVEAVLERKHLNAFGGAHGGAYASLLDCAAYWALYCSLDEDEGFYHSRFERVQPACVGAGTGRRGGSGRQARAHHVPM